MSMSRPSPSLEVSQGACGVMPSTSGIGSSCPPPSCAKSPASYGRIFLGGEAPAAASQTPGADGGDRHAQSTLHVILHDPDDNRILECAVEGQAHLIVSGDRDLRRLKIYQGIPIVTPTDFLRTLGG